MKKIPNYLRMKTYSLFLCKNNHCLLPKNIKHVPIFTKITLANIDEDSNK